MFHIHEANPAEINYLCPKASFGKDSGLAVHPFSTCGDCPYMSHMSCQAVHGEENFAQNSKKALQTF
jgi:hypothetical protein